MAVFIQSQVKRAYDNKAKAEGCSTELVKYKQ